MFSYNLNFFSLTTIVLQYNLQELIGISTLTILPLHQDETRLKISQLSRTVSIQNVHHPKQPDSNPIESIYRTRRSNRSNATFPKPREDSSFVLEEAYVARCLGGHGSRTARGREAILKIGLD